MGQTTIVLIKHLSQGIRQGWLLGFRNQMENEGKWSNIEEERDEEHGQNQTSWSRNIAVEYNLNRDLLQLCCNSNLQLLVQAEC